MFKKRKKKEGASTRDLMGITGITDYSVCTGFGDLVFFIVEPTNISVLPDASVSARIHALLDVLKGQVDIDMLALNSSESFESNQSFYQKRLSQEELPAIRKLLKLDGKHLDRIQALMASAREFYMVVRLRNNKESDVLQYLSNIERSIRDRGFITRRASEQDIKRMLGIYFEQNVTTDHYFDYDGERWFLMEEEIVD